MSGVEKIKQKADEMASKAKDLVTNNSDDTDVDEATEMDEVEVRVADTGEVVDEITAKQPPLIH